MFEAFIEEAETEMAKEKDEKSQICIICPLHCVQARPTLNRKSVARVEIDVHRSSLSSLTEFKVLYKRKVGEILMVKQITNNLREGKHTTTCHTFQMLLKQFDNQVYIFMIFTIMCHFVEKVKKFRVASWQDMKQVQG